MAKILFKKLLPNAVIPTKGTSEAAAFDLVAAAVEYNASLNMVIVDTGLATAFPAGYVLHLYGRSGLAAKHKIRLCNSVAVIDADYRGPIKILLTSDTTDFHWLTRIKVGDRVAQAILVKLPDVEWEEVDELPDSVRGEGGFGSTGQRQLEKQERFTERYGLGPRKLTDVLREGPFPDFKAFGAVEID